jgi:hypothetical protein
MNFSQGSFEVLDARTLSDTCGNQLVHDSLSKAKCAPESIDELLAEYKHTQSSICEFIACLNGRSSGTASQDISIPRGLELTKTENVQENAISNSTAAPLNHGCKRKSSDMSLDEQQNPEKNAHSGCKSRNTHMSAREKEDRRRDQNREAQRRFREKCMLFSSPVIYKK